MTNVNKKYFITHLLSWHCNNNFRELPWKNINNPYKIWLSEILLQQTKATQAIPYYNAFIKAFPTIKHLSNAPQDTIFKMWQGLGYYQRCKNLIFTAKYIANNLNGVFPNNYKDILSLKGVGTYTAAAIASFAFKLPYAVFDGNVYRVLSRYFGIHNGCFTSADKLMYMQLAQQLLPINNNALYNQAIMDFGATVCTPKKPNCLECCLQKKCVAYLEKIVENLPIKKMPILKKQRHLHYIVVVENNKTFIKIRSQKDIWQNLYEFYLIESTSNLISLKNASIFLPAPVILVQNLTHQTINTYFYVIYKWHKSLKNKNLYTSVKITELNTFAMPKSIVEFLNNNLL